MKQRITIMNNKPDVSDEEIKGYMDFDKLLEARNHATPLISLGKLYVALGVLVISTGVWLYIKINQPTIDSHGDSKVPNASELNVPPVSTLDSGSHTVGDSVNAKPLEKTMLPKKPSNAEKAKVQKDNASASQQSDVNYKAIVDSYFEAEPVAGYPHFYEYINTNLKYPVEGMGDSIQGVETVSFTINANGEVENIRVRHSLGKAFDDESIRVIKQMPAWRPASINRKSVASQISIPLTFHMERLK